MTTLAPLNKNYIKSGNQTFPNLFPTIDTNSIITNDISANSIITNSISTSDISSGIITIGNNMDCGIYNISSNGTISCNNIQTPTVNTNSVITNSIETNDITGIITINNNISSALDIDCGQIACSKILTNDIDLTSTSGDLTLTNANTDITSGPNLNVFLRVSVDGVLYKIQLRSAI